MSEIDEVVKEFLVECHESLDQLDSDFLALEENPEDRDRLASIFRTVHTIKGTSGFLAFPKLERVTHVGENLLVPLRDGEIQLTHEMASSLLGMVDAVREILKNIEQVGAEGDETYGELINELERMLHGDQACAASDQDSGTEELTAVEDAQSDFCEPSCELPVDSEQLDMAAVASLSDASAPAAEKKADVNISEKSSSLADSSVRIDVGLLDQLMNLVGELVLARNQILQYGESSEDANMFAASQRLNLITTELQEGVMKTRMQPIRNAWNKLPRVVRDLSASCGKNVEVRMEGADTELDKTILEAIKDPLTHIVRNSVDHGIESSEVRAEKGKPAVGTLLLRAFHEGGQVNIEISDDGGGINPERIRQKAIEKGLVNERQANSMNDRELISLILLPGFSTAEKVTNVSGRGVGMDVVKTNIERIGGTLDIQSAYGIGTTLRIKIPLTLAIVPALIVASGESQYAIPQVNLLELVRLSGERMKEIEFIHDAPVYRLRGNLLPLVYLDEQLGFRKKRTRHEHDEAVNLIVLQAEDRSFGLVVDSVTDTQEIVVKPLGQHLKDIPSFAGATIMGDGSVTLILDAIGLARKGNILGEKHEHALTDRNEQGAREGGETESLLVVETHEKNRLAIRLSTVARLEEFSTDQIEYSQQGQVIQYRGDIMPLVGLNGEPVVSESGRMDIVVYTCNGLNVGIVVGKIIDVVEARVDTERLIIQDRVTDLLDLDQLVRSYCPDIFQEPVSV